MIIKVLGIFVLNVQGCSTMLDAHLRWTVVSKYSVQLFSKLDRILKFVSLRSASVAADLCGCCPFDPATDSQTFLSQSRKVDGIPLA